MAVGGLHKIEVRHKHTRHWVWYITAISFVTGALFAASLRTQGKLREGFGDTTVVWRVDWLAERWRAARDENKELRETIQSLYATLAEYDKTMAEGGQVQKLLSKELQKYKVLMGLTELKGPGVVLTLKDSTLRAPANDPEMAEGLIIHDRDLQQIVNELRAAGAEAIAINEQRLVERSAIRCVGPVTHINNVPTGPPYVITAIGDPQVLRSGLTIKGGVIDGLKLLQFPVELKTMTEVRVPAFGGSSELKYAQPVEPAEATPAPEEAKQ